MVQAIWGRVSEGSRSASVAPDRMKAVITASPPTERAAHQCTAVAFSAALACATSSITPALAVISSRASSAIPTSVRRRGSVERITSLRRCQREGWRKVGPRPTFL